MLLFFQHEFSFVDDFGAKMKNSMVNWMVVNGGQLHLATLHI